MRRLLLVFSLLVVTPAVAKTWSEHWAATSDTATSITGDVTLYSAHISVDGKSVPIRKVHNIPIADPAGYNGLATLYRVSPPVNPVLLHGNRLCGTNPISYVLIWHSKAVMPGDPPGRGLALFTGGEPSSLGSACATYYYEIQ
jgi:hypothetical protein